MWNEEYKDEYIKTLEEENKQLRNKLNDIDLLVSFWNGIDNDFIVSSIMDGTLGNTRNENDLAKEIFNL